MTQIPVHNFSPDSFQPEDTGEFIVLTGTSGPAPVALAIPWDKLSGLLGLLVRGAEEGREHRARMGKTDALDPTKDLHALFVTGVTTGGVTQGGLALRSLHTQGLRYDFAFSTDSRTAAGATVAQEIVAALSVQPSPRRAN